MDDLLSEKEQIEVLRAWWKENRLFIIGGIVLGVAILVGWNQWKAHRLTTRLEASALFEALAEDVNDGRLEDSEATANDLYDNYGSTTYAALARLAMARLYMDKGRDQDAADTLSALLAVGGSDDLKMVARLRLAKLYLYQEKPQEVVDLLSGFEGTAFAARFDELLGDAYAALGQTAEATDAYTRAMDDDIEAPTVNRALIQMKIVDLPDALPADMAPAPEETALQPEDTAPEPEEPANELDQDQ